MASKPFHATLAGLVGLAWMLALTRSAAAEATPSAREVFERRILPIFNSPNPSSCTECHLAGVDLKHYILPSHEKTFLSLRDQGLVDLENPRASKILRLISMKDEPGTGASLINERVRQSEQEAFAEWVDACAKDTALRRAPKLAPQELAAPKRPREIIRHARVDRLLESFVDNVWSQRFRCLGCHSPSGSENAKLVAEHGNQVAWIKTTARETMNYLIESGDLINTARPERSRLLLKPLNEIKHEGGQKMLPGDFGYKAFRTWLEDYAKIARDQYASASDLPQPRSAPAAFPTEIWMKIANTPAAWAERLLQIRVYAWDASRETWEAEPIAESDRMVSGKLKLWQHSLLLLARKGSDRAQSWKAKPPALSSGRYLIRVHVDTSERLRQDWTAEMSDQELAGEVVVESSWPPGYNRMTVVDASRVRKN